MDKFMGLGLDGTDQETSIIILCSYACVIMMWMTGRNDITEPISRERRNMERGLYLRRVIETVTPIGSICLGWTGSYSSVFLECKD